MTHKLLAAAMAAMLFAGLCLAADKPNDDLIRDRVMLKVGSDPDAKVGDLGVELKDGVATLTGIVETPSQKDKATKLAKKVKGVKQVVNNIRLRDKAGSK
jgi:osmotically-inducible protein OsmY